MILFDALALEGLVADREDLVEEQHVGPNVDRDRESEPHLHPGRVRAHGEVDEPLELCEVDDLLEPLVDRAPLEPVDRSAQSRRSRAR